MSFSSDTICALASGNVSGAIAVVRVSGKGCFGVVDSVVKFRRGCAAGCRSWNVRFGEVSEEDGGLLDEVVVALYPAPHSYTGEDCAEISCHASPYIVSALIERLCAVGAVPAAHGEFTQRAFLNGKLDLAQAEAVADVIAASSRAAHRIAANQLRGTFSSEFRSLRDSLLELSALVELELDFSEEEVEFADRSHLRSLLSGALSRVSSLRDSYRVGNAIKSGVPVAIVGAPNSGKSTLLNALVREDRAIVSDIAGTTRDTIEETFVYDGVSYRFIDTAGLRETSDEVEAIGVKRAYSALERAEIVIGVVDASLASAGEEMLSLEKLVGEGQHFIGVFNKADLVDMSTTCRGDGAHSWCHGILPTSWVPSLFGSQSSVTPTGAPSLPGAEVSTLALKDKFVVLSARQGRIGDLLKAIGECGYAQAADTVLVTGERHHSALCAACESLSAAIAALDAAVPADLFAEDLRAAIASVNSILGESLGYESRIDVESVLGTVFSRFCIGK